MPACPAAGALRALTQGPAATLGSGLPAAPRVCRLLGFDVETLYELHYSMITLGKVGGCALSACVWPCQELHNSEAALGKVGGTHPSCV